MPAPDTTELPAEPPRAFAANLGPGRLLKRTRIGVHDRSARKLPPGPRRAPLLFDTGLVIRFSLGSTIDIISAAVTHGNAPIHAGERRYSLTEYVASGLLRWVRVGFQPAQVLTDADEILARFSTPGLLREDRAHLLQQEAARSARRTGV
jgi:hypothetical protein